MDILFLVFALISFILFMDGMLLKTDRFKSLLIKSFKREDAKDRVDFISNLMITTSIITLGWIGIGYLMGNTLPIELFIVGYFILLAVAGISLVVTFKTRFR